MTITPHGSNKHVAAFASITRNDHVLELSPPVTIQIRTVTAANSARSAGFWLYSEEFGINEYMPAAPWTFNAYCATMQKRFAHVIEQRILLLWELAKIKRSGGEIDPGPLADAVDSVNRRAAERPRRTFRHAEGHSEPANYAAETTWRPA